MVTVKKLSMVIVGVVFSTSSLGLEATHAADMGSMPPMDMGSMPPMDMGNSPSEPPMGGDQDFLVVPPDAPSRPSYFASGDTYTFLATGKETDGQLSLFNFDVPVGGGPNPHVHRFQDEAFYVLDGQLTVQDGDQSVVANPGTYVYLPQGIPHEFHNFGTTPARTLSISTPAGLDQFIAANAQPVTDRNAPPPPLTPADIQRVAASSSTFGIIPLPSTTTPTGLHPTEKFFVVPPTAPGRESVSIAGNRYTSLATNQETGGRYSLFDVSLPPQAKSGLLSSNSQDQALYVLNGDLSLQLGDQTVDAPSGTFVYLPKSKQYAYQNLGTTPVETLLLDLTPTPVPEPSSWLGILGFGAFFGSNLVLKRKQKKQKLAKLSKPEGSNNLESGALGPSPVASVCELQICSGGCAGASGVDEKTTLIDERNLVTPGVQG